MSPPQRQSVAQISAELGIHVVTLYSCRKAWRLQGQVERWPQASQDENVQPLLTMAEQKALEKRQLSWQRGYQRNNGDAVEIYCNQGVVYEQPRQRNPRRWSRSTRCRHQPEVI